MNALVLAAGKSTRIAGVSGGRPKPLLEVGGKPVIERTLGWLASSGIRDVWINLHYRPDEIRDTLGDGSRFGVRITYAHEPEILGTAGAFASVARDWRDTSLVVYGDNLMSFDLARFVAAHRAGGAGATIALFDPDRHANTRIAGGRVVLDGEGFITSFAESRQLTADSRQPTADGRQPVAGSRFVNAGAYLLEPGIHAAIGAGLKDFAHDVFPALVAGRRLHGHVIEAAGYCLGLDTPESFRVAEALVSTRQVVLA